MLRQEGGTASPTPPAQGDLAARGDAAVLVVDGGADVPGAAGVAGDAVPAALCVATVAVSVAAGMPEGGDQLVVDDFVVLVRVAQRSVDSIDGS